MPKRNQLSVAIELGSFNFKIAVVNCSNAKARLEFFKVVNISDIPVENRINYVAELLEKELISRVIFTRNILINFCDDTLQVKIIDLPNIPKNEIRQAAQLYLNTKFGIDSSFIFDYEINGQKTDNEGNKKIEVVCAVARKDRIQQICQALINKGFIIGSINISAFSLIALLRELGVSQKETIAVIDIGYSSTDFIVYHEYRIKFFRRFFIGSKQFNQALEEKMQIRESASFSSSENSNKTQNQKPIENVSAEQEYDLTSGQLLSALRASLEKFVSELKHSIDYYQENAQTPPVKNIFIVGGGGIRFKNLNVFLNQRMNATIRIIQIPNSIADSYLEKQELENNFAIIANVVGLALAPQAKMNLLPPEFQLIKIQKKVINYIRLSEIVIAIVFLIFVAFTFYNSKKLQGELKLILKERESLEDLRILGDRIQYRNNLEDRLKKEKISADWYLKEISRIIPDTIILTSIDLNIRDGTLKLDGIASASEKDGTTEISRFMDRIEDSSFFKSTDLSSSSKIPKGEGVSFSFSIKSKLE